MFALVPRGSSEGSKVRKSPSLLPSSCHSRPADTSGRGRAVDAREECTPVSQRHADRLTQGERERGATGQDGTIRLAMPSLARERQEDRGSEPRHQPSSARERERERERERLLLT